MLLYKFVKQKRILVLMIIVLFVGAVISLLPTLAANLGWIYLTRAILDIPTHQPQLDKANAWFFHSRSSGNESVSIGENIAEVLQTGEYRPVHEGEDTLVARNRYTTVATYFESKDEFEYAARLYALAIEENRSDLLYDVALGGFCQRHRDLLTEDFPDVRHYCNEWLHRNQNNWFVNPHFEGEEAPGWWLIPSNRASRANLVVSTLSSTKNSVLAMINHGRLEESNSFCQRIVLLPTEVVEFGVTLETLPAIQNSMEVHVLYLGWRDSQGRSQGNQALIIDTATPNTSYARQFALPNGSNSSVLFCPVMAKGDGQVNLSNVWIKFSNGKQ